MLAEGETLSHRARPVGVLGGDSPEVRAGQGSVLFVVLGGKGQGGCVSPSTPVRDSRKFGGQTDLGSNSSLCR